MELLALLFSVALGRLTVEESNQKTLESCIHEDSIEVQWEKVDVLPIMMACQMERRRAKAQGRKVRKIVITSICREDGSRRSKHYNCAATDFYYFYLADWNECDVWNAYLNDALDILYWCDETDTPCRNGIYDNLSHHLDLEGRWASWGFIEGVQYSYRHVLSWIEEKIEDVCHG